ncbi:MAG: hypothetical protein AAF753_08780, partial [Pseudomonadota bacterium]
MEPQDPMPETEQVAPMGQRRVDPLQLVFWASLLVAVAAASLAIAWPEAVGSTGPVLLIAMAAGGMVFLLWVLRGAGRKLGLFPDRELAAAMTAPQSPRFQWIEALDEAVLISDRSGTPIAANTAYDALAGLALTRLDGQEAVSVDRLFNASPAVSAPVFRLGKAARSGEARREILPPVTLGRDGVPAHHPTGPVVFGEPGTNGQHAFYQLIHQGTDIVPCDFLVAAEPHEALGDHHQKLLANVLAQSQALMRGRTLDEAKAQLL